MAIKDEKKHLAIAGGTGAVVAAGATAKFLHGVPADDKQKILRQYGGNISYTTRGFPRTDRVFKLPGWGMAQSYGDGKQPKGFKGSTLLYVRGQEGLNPVKGKPMPKLDAEALTKGVTHRVINPPEAYALFEDKYKFYHNFKNPEAFMPKTYRASEFKSLEDIHKRVGKDFVIKDVSNMGGLSFRKFDPTPEGVAPYLGKKQFIIQEKVPITHEFRVHALGDTPYFIRPKGATKTAPHLEDKVLQFARRAIGDMKQFKAEHHGLDVAISRTGALKIIEDNAASGYQAMPKASRGLTRLVRHGRTPYLGTQKARFRTRAGIAVGAATVGAYGASKLYSHHKKEASTKRTKTDIAIDVGGGAAVVGGAGAFAIGKKRSRYQAKVDPNLITLRGGQTDPQFGTKAPTTVFTTQRKAWASRFRELGYDVEELANFDINRAESKRYSPGTFAVSPQSGKRPLVELDVGRNLNESYRRTRLDRLLTGKQKYRVFSDYGAGNQKTTVNLLGSKSWMHAPSDKTYVRNVVPGGDVVPAQRAAKANINVDTIPAAQVFRGVKSRKLTKPGRTTYSLMGGTGYGWPVILPKQKRDVQEIVKALSTKHGKDFRLNILGGPNVSQEFADIFKGVVAENKDTVRYVPKVSLKNTSRLHMMTDTAIMAPGSMMTELASLEGYKPKILALKPQSSEHFGINVEWLKKRMGGVEGIGIKQLEQGQILKSLEALDAQKMPTTEGIKFKAKDTTKIVDTARKDFAASKKFTGRLKLIGGVTAGAGAVALAAPRIKKSLERKK